MPISSIGDVSFGEELPAFVPDTSLDTGRKFADLVGFDGGRFNDHEAARKEGFPGAIIAGVLCQGYLLAMIHAWAPDAQITNVDTVFRAPVVADEPHTITGVVTDINEEDGMVEIDLTVSNDKSETRVFGTASVSLPR
jgi:acyl dehydratase